MKSIYINSLVVIGSLLLNSVAQAGSTSSAPTEVFVHAENTVQTTAACIVGSVAGSKGIAACLCEASADEFSFCDKDSGSFVITNNASVAWAAALGATGSELSTKIKAWDTKTSKLLIDARAECTLNQGDAALSLDLSSNPELQGMIGGTIAYSAIYYWPTVGGFPAGDPVKLCALGSGKIYAKGSIPQETNVNNPSLDFALDVKDIGLTGGFMWAAENIKYGHDSGREVEHMDKSAKGTDVGVRFLLVAATAAAEINAGDANISGVAVLTQTKLRNRILHAEAKSNLFVKDLNPVVVAP